MAGSTRYEIETKSDWGLQNPIFAIENFIDRHPDLNAAFDLVSFNGAYLIDDVAASVASLGRVRSTNADARLIEDIIEPAYRYCLRDKILLGAVFDHAKKNGHAIAYHQKANGHVEARIGPKPQ